MKYNAEIKLTYDDSGKTVSKHLRPFRARCGKNPESVAFETAFVLWGDRAEVEVISVTPVGVTK